MFNAALIVFRETLEAALVIGILAAATRPLRGRTTWIALGIAGGTLGAVVLAVLAEYMSRLADGMGHEIFNASVLAMAILMLAWHNIWMSEHGRELAAQARDVGAAAVGGRVALGAVALAVGLTVLREGAETVLFFFGLLAASDVPAATLWLGAILGLAGGVAAGTVIYAGLVRVPVRHVFSVTGWMVLLLTAGMAGQLAQVLIQADVVSPMVQPLWDTSSWVPPQSGLGTFLHALVGYDPQPSATQIAFALGAVAAVLLATRWVHHRARTVKRA